jgi:hypothetical protein
MFRLSVREEAVFLVSMLLIPFPREPPGGGGRGGIYVFYSAIRYILYIQCKTIG